MKVSVIIPTYNSTHLLHRTLPTIFGGGLVPNELVIVDDGSDGNVRAELTPLLSMWSEERDAIWRIIELDRDHSASPYPSGWLNPAIPINVGLRHATGDILITTTAECLWPRTALDQFLFWFSQPLPLFAPTARTYYMLTRQATENLNLLDVDSLSRNPLLLEGKLRRMLSSAWYNRPTSSYIALRRDWAHRTRGMDESWVSAGGCDTEWLLRLNHIGVQRVMSKDLCMIHQWHDRSHRDYGSDPLYPGNMEKLRRAMLSTRESVNGPDWGTAGGQVPL